MGEIEKVHVTKFLGIYIDNRLDWKRHIDLIINKVSKSISIIYRASQKLNETALLMLYNTYRLLDEYGEILTRVSIAMARACECHANDNECQYFSIFVQ